ncbi:MAG: hypothetical protein ACOCQQ_03485 [Candidatus Nanoarchaeia archaeon]
MVLENLFPSNWLEKRFGFALLLGAGSSLIGIVLAQLLFGANSGLASVIFSSLLIIPSMYKMINQEERLEEHERGFSLKRLYADNKGLIHAYVGIFFGVYVTYLLLSFAGTYFGWDVISMFQEQLFLDPAVQGRATAFSFQTLWSILHNNWWVLLACFGLSLLTGNGATFFIVWNASAWGAIFGMRAVAAAAVLGKSAVGSLLTMQAIVLPHVILEGGAYILAGIAGAIISSDIVSESNEMNKFLGLMLFGILLFYVLNIVFSFITIIPIIILLRMVTVLLVVYFLRFAFLDKKHRQVFKYNYWLFVCALVLFIIGAIVESGVLSWSGTLHTLYSAAAIFFS